MSEWRTMDSVPKNGDWFLATWDGRVTVAKWLDSSEKIFGEWCGFVVPSMWPRPRNAEPSHWMPLPAPADK